MSKLITVELTLEVEADYKPGREAVMPHGGNPDGSPPEGPEIEITKILLPAESSKQIDILPFINASTLVEIEDAYIEMSFGEDD